MDDTGQEIFGDDILDSTVASEQLENAEQFGRGGVITARGTVDGVVVRLDGRVDRESLKAAVEDFLSVRRAFLGGNEVSLEWIGARPDESLLNELTSLLLDKFNITVKSSKLRDSVVLDTDGSRSTGNLSAPASVNQTRKPNLVGSPRQESRLERQETSRPKSLFDGMEAISDTRQNFSKQSPASKRVSVNQSNLSQVESFWDDADARIVYTTLRSGQKIETDHSLIVFGDVNSGAEIVAGGDIIVLGTLRGVAHAGAYDETGGGRVIFALNLQATQLRIGMVISRGSADSQKAPEIARVEGGLIIVEPYSVKNLGSVRNLGSKN